MNGFCKNILFRLVDLIYVQIKIVVYYVTCCCNQNGSRDNPGQRFDFIDMKQRFINTIVKQPLCHNDEYKIGPANQT